VTPRLVVLPLDCAQRIEDVLKFVEAHHAAPESVQKAALAAMTDLRRNWQWADVNSESVTATVPAYPSQTVTGA